MNENWERLVNLCGVIRLVATGTLFPHKHKHKLTWTSRNGRHENQIDRVLVSKQHRTSVLDTRVRPQFFLFFVWRESLPDFLNIWNKNKSAYFDLHFYFFPRLQLFLPLEKNQIWCDPSNMVKLEIVELKLLENVDLCSCYVIQHFCDIVFVPSSYDYDGLCNRIE